jgi:hypothetical protein
MPTQELIPQLGVIVAAKRRYVEERKNHTSIETLRSEADRQRRPLPLLTEVLLGPERPIHLMVHLTPETLPDLLHFQDVDGIAFYNDDHFAFQDLDEIVKLNHLMDKPILARDVFLDEFQVVEMRTAGASALLLRAAILEPGVLRTLVSVTQRYRMTAIVQVHNEADLDFTVSLSPYVIALSTRDLWTDHPLKVDLAALRRRIPSHIRVMLAEPLDSLAAVEQAVALDVDAVLVQPHLLMDVSTVAELSQVLRRTPQEPL